jgi:hypothetical protein
LVKILVSGIIILLWYTTMTYDTCNDGSHGNRRRKAWTRRHLSACQPRSITRQDAGNPTTKPTRDARCASGCCPMHYWIDVGRRNNFHSDDDLKIRRKPRGASRRHDAGKLTPTVATPFKILIKAFKNQRTPQDMTIANRRLASRRQGKTPYDVRKPREATRHVNGKPTLVVATPNAHSKLNL